MGNEGRKVLFGGRADEKHLIFSSFREKKICGAEQSYQVTASDVSAEVNLIQ